MLSHLARVGRNQQFRCMFFPEKASAQSGVVVRGLVKAVAKLSSFVKLPQLSSAKRAPRLTPDIRYNPRNKNFWLRSSDELVPAVTSRSPLKLG